VLITIYAKQELNNIQEFEMNKQLLKIPEHDNTKAQRKLEKLREYYRSVYNKRWEGYLTINRQGVVYSANATMAKMFRIERSNLMNFKITRFIAPKYHKEFMLNLKDVFDENISNRLELPMYRFDLTEFFARIHFSPINIEGKLSETCRLVILDISDLKISEKYIQLFMNSRDGMLVFKAGSGEITDANSYIAKLIRCPRENLIGKKIWEVEQFKFIAGDFIAFSTLKERDYFKHKDISIRDAVGQQIEVEFSSGVCVYDEEKVVQCNIHEITRYKNTEAALSERVSELTLTRKISELLDKTMDINLIIKSILDIVVDWLTYPVGYIYLINPLYKDSSFFVTRRIDEESVKQLGDITKNRDIIQQIISNGQMIVNTDVEVSKAIDPVYSAHLKSQNIKSLAGVRLTSHDKNMGVMILFSDKDKILTNSQMRTLDTLSRQIGRVIEHTQLVGNLNLWARVDELTGLFNRRYFYEALEKEINRCQHSNSTFSVLMMDIDKFKRYNDKFGHIFGDKLLYLLARITTSSLRKSDISCRYGGDEFAIILPGMSSEKAALIGDRIRAAYFERCKVELGIAEHGLGLSIGAVDYSVSAETPGSLVFMADCALYSAKKAGGNVTKRITEIKSLPNKFVEIATVKDIQDLAAVIDAKTQKAAGHSKRVSEIAVRIGQKYGMATADLEQLQLAADLHDIGKLSISEEILNKNVKLTAKEWSILREHSNKGSNLVSRIKPLRELGPIILHHHEWYNGNGYPKKLKGEEIPLEARIISIADAYDTMVTPRTYRKIFSQRKALEELFKYSGTQFDPKLTKIVPEALNITSEAVSA